MPVCKFGERQYELAANLELLGGSGSFFAPTTSLEGQLGIDVALAPSDQRIWQLLGIPPPEGVATGTAAFPGWPNDPGLSTPFLVSLFIQYKRSSYLTRSYSNEWGSHKQPYWRVELSSRQHHLLTQLEAATAGNAVVRYAAPRFWRHEDMWKYQAIGGVLDNSLLIAPSEIGPNHDHLTWSSGVGLLAHSSPERLHDESPAGLARAMLREATASGQAPERRDPRSYLANLAATVTGLGLPGRRRDQRREDLSDALVFREVSEEDIGPLADIATIAEAAGAARASWLMVSLTRRQTPETPGAEE
ncbi:MAG TPA: hypothetical protein VL988_03120 [Solirubrobacteraceae bacterium]|nr:hypothetical protein [Solirubrobacteraceae bacterium]